MPKTALLPLAFLFGLNIPGCGAEPHRRWHDRPQVPRATSQSSTATGNNRRAAHIRWVGVVIR